MDPIVVIGAGAAGIFAARRAAELGAPVLLLEKTPRVGTKILISGGGKCNITHDGPLEDVLRAFRPAEARFIRPACYRWTNRQVVEFLERRGLKVYTRPDGRIFPVDRTAKDVVAILRRSLQEVGVKLRLETPVLGICADDSGTQAVQVRNETIATRHVVLAVGGSSYPNSGTTGDGWTWAATLGHRIEPIRAALAPMHLLEKRWRAYSGVALRDVVLKARQSGKEVVRWRGDVLLTHVGISGPCALGVSRDVAEALERGPVTAEVDLRPDETFESVGAALVECGRLHPSRRVASYLDELIPERLVPEMMIDAGIPEETTFSKLPQKGRNRLVECLKGWKLGGIREVDLDKGEVVAGGIALDEVDPQSMRSIRCAGLYCCGEVLDIAGPVGGYNLQAAFATGFVAGESAAKDWLASQAQG